MARIGDIRCPFAADMPARHTKGDRAPVGENKTGTLSWRCPYCEASGYATRGTPNHKHILEVLDRDDDASPPAPAPGPAPRAALLIG